MILTTTALFNYLFSTKFFKNRVLFNFTVIMLLAISTSITPKWEVGQQHPTGPFYLLLAGCIPGDFFKAFNFIIHSFLLNNPNLLGIHNNLYRWIKSFICNFNQVILIEGVLSKSIEVIHGVPQGSHVVPLTFNIYKKQL